MHAALGFLAQGRSDSDGMWKEGCKRFSLIITLASIPLYSLHPEVWYDPIPCLFRLGSEARVSPLARRGAMDAVAARKHPVDPCTTWSTSSRRRTGVAELQGHPQSAGGSASLTTGAALSLHEGVHHRSASPWTGAASEAPVTTDARLASPWTGVAVQVTNLTQTSFGQLARSTISATGVAVSKLTEFIANFSFPTKHALLGTIYEHSEILTDANPVNQTEVSGEHATTSVTITPIRRLRSEHSGITTVQLLASLAGSLVMLFICAISCHMVLPGGGNRDTNHRTPPGWGPENEASYSFKTYMTDLMLWSMLTDLAPHQQAAAIILRLQGAAKELARTLTPQEITTGGVVNGVQLDPVSYIVLGLHARFAQLGEETRLVAMTEMLSFHRKPNENINEVLTRYEVVRQRARVEGQFVMSTEGCALQLLRACGVNTTQLMQLLQPFGTNLPSNEMELSQMTQTMKRMGHILEGAPGNIASSLHGSRAQRSHLLAETYHASEYAGPNQGNAGWNEQNQSSWGEVVDSPEDNWFPANPWPTQPAYANLASSSWETTGGITAAPSGSEGMTSAAYWQSDWEAMESGYQSGTDSDTSSDSGNEEIDMSDLTGLNDSEASLLAYWQYRHAKRRWRRLTQKPTRGFRRLKRKFRKGKGKGFFRKGKGKSHGKGKGIFLAESEMSDSAAQESALAYLKGKGKGHRKGSTGKGTGRRKNPVGRDGQIMRCRTCGSDEHFAARCTQSGNSTQPPQLFVLQESPDGPLSELLGTDASNQRASEHPEAEESPLVFMVTSAPQTEDPLWSTQQDPWTHPVPAASTDAQSGNSHFGPNTRGPGFPRRQEQTSSDEPSSGGFVTATEHPENVVPNTNSVFLQQAYAGAPNQGSPATMAGGSLLTAARVDLTDQQLQHIFAGHRMATDLRIQHRQHMRNVREERYSGISRTANSIPTIFQQLMNMPTVGNVPARHNQSDVFSRQPPQVGNPPPVSMFQNVGAPPEEPNLQVAQTIGSLFSNTPIRSKGRGKGKRKDRPVRPDPEFWPHDDPPVGNPPVDPEELNPSPRWLNPHGPVFDTPPRNMGEVYPPEPQTPVIFDGDNRSCTVCIQDFEAGQRVIRLRCRHVFHGDCWMAVHLAHSTRTENIPTQRDDLPDCPNCRGLGEIIALWDYVDHEVLTQSGAPNLLLGNGLQQLRSRSQETPSRQSSNSQWGTPTSRASNHRSGMIRSRSSSVQRRPSSRATESVCLILPSTYRDANEWALTNTSTAPSEEPINRTSTYHSATRMPDGRPVLLIDPGSVGNLSGDQWARECAQLAMAHGLNPSQAKRPRPLSVMGVGNGNQTCTHNCTLPITLSRQDGSQYGGTYTTPVVSNSDLPGLLGLNTMRRNRCILDMVNLKLHMCGPADIRLNLPPGTESFQLEIAPSGHLVLPCGNHPPTGNAARASQSEIVLQASEGSNPQPPTPSTSSEQNLHL
jgi:hypothetical protein